MSQAQYEHLKANADLLDRQVLSRLEDRSGPCPLDEYLTTYRHRDRLYNELCAAVGLEPIVEEDFEDAVRAASKEAK